MAKNENIILPVYVITLKEVNGSEPIVNEFACKDEFLVKYITSIKNDYFGTYKACIDMGIKENQDVLIICNEFHRFTFDYNRDNFIKNIILSHNQNCDILCGSAGGINRVYPITRNRYWIDMFTHCNFIIVFKKFYNIFFNVSCNFGTTFFECISRSTMNKMVLYPFISMPDKSILLYDGGVDRIYNTSRNIFEISDKRLALYTWVFDEYLS